MCDKAVEEGPELLEYVPDQYKTQDLCHKAFLEETFSLQYFSHWFVTQGQVKSWHDDSEYYNDDKLIEWYKGYKKRKAQKVQIEKELLPIVWYPSRWCDWCVPRDDEKETKKLWG